MCIYSSGWNWTECIEPIDALALDEGPAVVVPFVLFNTLTKMHYKPFRLCKYWHLRHPPKNTYELTTNTRLLVLQEILGPVCGWESGTDWPAGAPWVTGDPESWWKSRRVHVPSFSSALPFPGELLNTPKLLSESVWSDGIASTLQLLSLHVGSLNVMVLNLLLPESLWHMTSTAITLLLDHQCKRCKIYLAFVLVKESY